MIIGKFNQGGQARITIVIHGPTGQQHSTEAMIDTGFSGFLSLPPETVAALQLVYHDTKTFTMGDNRDVYIAVYEGAEVTMNGRRREGFVLQSEGDAIIGLALMDGYRLCLDIETEGEVRLKLLPRRPRRSTTT